MAKKLTDLTNILTTLDNNDLVHGVDVSDPTQSAAGSSGKIKVSDLKDTLQITQGIAEWNSGATYQEDYLARESGTLNIYKSLTDDNINNILSDAANWELVGNLDVIGGVFSELETNNLTVNKKFNLNRTSEGIVSGAIDYVGANLIVGSEGGAPTDDLTDILGGVVGDVVILETASNSQVITVKHDFLATSNIRLAYDRDVVLASVQDRLVLQQNNSGLWIEVSRAILGDFIANYNTGVDDFNLPNGYFVQRGRYISGAHAPTIVFNKPFTSLISYTVVCTAITTQEDFIAVSNKTANSFVGNQYFRSGAARSTDFDWIAIGY